MKAKKKLGESKKNQQNSGFTVGGGFVVGCDDHHFSLSEPRSGMECLHTFRSKVLGLTTVDDRLLALTERGAYLMDRNGKRWRKVAT